MRRLAVLLAFLSMPAHPDTIILHDGVAVTYCGGKEIVVNGTVSYVWPCIIFRSSFEP